MEQTKQVNKVKLITTDMGSFILFLWILKRNQEASVIREMLNIPIYLWNIDAIDDYKFSLHFLVYMAKYLTTPSCCSPEKNPYMLGWVSNAMTQKIEWYHTFIERHRNEVLKIEKYLEEMQSSLNGFTTMYSKLNTIPTEEVSTTSKFTCLTCGVGRRSHCRYCMHHNIVFLEILHQPECWRCYTPYLYVSNKIRTGFNVYFFTINMLEKNVTLGWHVIPRSNVSVKTWSQVKLHLESESCSRPLFLDWGMIELFKQCSHCECMPTLRNMMLMYVVQNYNQEWEPPEIPQHLAVDLDKLKYTVNRFTHI